ncbi:MAG: hypothetical protein V4735_04355 [Pseudomonadota bacterium]
MLEFSPAGYGHLLTAIKTHGYRTIPFDAAVQTTEPSRRLLLRHDIDFSLDYAHAMATQEAAMGLTATYFVMLRSPMYNLMSRHNATRLRDIAAMGHAIGLHFDAAYNQGSERSLAAWIRFEAETLSALAATPVTAFSLHQPSPEVLQQNILIEGLVNTYHPTQLAAFTYLSDSNRDWRGKDPIALMQAGTPHIHLLTHPMWWMNENPTTHGCWDDVIALNFSRMQEQLLATERAYGEKRRIQIGPAAP